MSVCRLANQGRSFRRTRSYAWRAVRTTIGLMSTTAAHVMPLVANAKQMVTHSAEFEKATNYSTRLTSQMQRGGASTPAPLAPTRCSRPACPVQTAVKHVQPVIPVTQGRHALSVIRSFLTESRERTHAWRHVHLGHISCKQRISVWMHVHHISSLIRS